MGEPRYQIQITESRHNTSYGQNSSKTISNLFADATNSTLTKQHGNHNRKKNPTKKKEKKTPQKINRITTG